MVFSKDEEQFESLKKICRNLVEHKNVRDLLADVADISAIAVKTVKQWGVENEDYIGVVPTDEHQDALLETTIDDDNNRVYLHWDNSIHCNSFMDAVSRLAQLLREPETSANHW